MKSDVKLHSVADNEHNIYYLYDDNNIKINVPESIAIILVSFGS